MARVESRATKAAVVSFIFFITAWSATTQKTSSELIYRDHVVAHLYHKRQLHLQWNLLVWAPALIVHAIISVISDKRKIFKGFVVSESVEDKLDLLVTHSLCVCLISPAKLTVYPSFTVLKNSPFFQLIKIDTISFDNESLSVVTIAKMPLETASKV